MAKVTTIESKPKGGSLIGQIAILLVMTLLAGGAGWGMGGFMSKKAPDATEAKTNAAPAAGHDAPAAEPAKDAHGAPTAVDEGGGHGADPHAALAGNALSLDPIVTNLSSPADVWVRLEMALVVDAPMEQKMTQAVQQDIFAYIRSVRLSQLEGPSGFISLKADILDRAKIRSAGKVKNILIKTLLFE